MKLKHTMKNSLYELQSYCEHREKFSFKGTHHLYQMGIHDFYTKQHFELKLKYCQDLLSQREELVKFVSSFGFTVASFDPELRLILCEISVRAIQLQFDESDRLNIDKLATYERLLRSLKLQINSPEQFVDIMEFLNCTEYGSPVKFILDQLNSHTSSIRTSAKLSLFGIDPFKAQPKLFNSAWFQKYSRSVAVAKILLFDEYRDIELAMLNGASHNMLRILFGMRSKILHLCCLGRAQLTPVLMVCSCKPYTTGT